MPDFLFPDCLDSVRNTASDEASLLTAAQVKLQLMLGYSLKLSQTQAFDSVHLLSYAADPVFLELVRNGAVHITLGEGMPGPMEAFLSKVGSPAFHFSAWTELPRPSLPEAGRDAAKLTLSAERSAMLRVMRERYAKRKALPEDYPATLQSRWRLLLKLDMAYLQANAVQPFHRWRPAQNLGRKLSEEIAAVLPFCREDESVFQGLLSLQKLSSSDRSVHRLYVDHHYCNDRSPAYDQETGDALHALVDMLYNEVVAHSIGAAAALSTPVSRALDIMARREQALAVSAASTAAEQQGAALFQLLPGARFSERLEPLTWSALYEMREVMADTSQSQDYKLDMLRNFCTLTVAEVQDAAGNAGIALQFLPALADTIGGQAASQGVSLLLHGAPDGGLVSSLAYFALQQTQYAPGKWIRRILEKCIAAKTPTHEDELFTLLKDHAMPRLEAAVCDEPLAEASGHADGKSLTGLAGGGA